MSPILDGLPCQREILNGIQDLENARVTLEACLASMASPRLVRAGFLTPETVILREAELKLYRILQTSSSNAYGTYNALLRELSSFEHALDARMKKLSAHAVH